MVVVVAILPVECHLPLLIMLSSVSLRLRICSRFVVCGAKTTNKQTNKWQLHAFILFKSAVNVIKLWRVISTLQGCRKNSAILFPTNCHAAALLIGD